MGVKGRRERAPQTDAFVCSRNAGHPSSDEYVRNSCGGASERDAHVIARTGTALQPYPGKKRHPARARAAHKALDPAQGERLNATGAPPATPWRRQRSSWPLASDRGIHASAEPARYPTRPATRSRLRPGPATSPSSALAGRTKRDVHLVALEPFSRLVSCWQRGQARIEPLRCRTHMR